MVEIATLVATIGEAAASAAAAAGEAAATVGTAAAGAAEAYGGSLALLGTGLSVAGTVAAGQAAKEQGEFAAKQEKRAAAEDLSVATRAAEDRRQKTALILSAQKANAAASGAGVDNPTIFDIMGDTAQQGDYLARSDIFGGKNRAAGDLDQAAAARYKGNAAYAGSLLEGAGTGLTGLYKYTRKTGGYG
jgi:hypothetical protein